MGIEVSKVLDLLASAKTKLYAARLKRPTPFVDKTVYVNWNAMCVSAYLQAAQVLGLEDARKFALRSLDRILAGAWDAERGLSHVIAYADAKAEKRFVRGLLDDYAFTVLACLDAYEVTGAMSYFKFAQQIADEMIRRFGDPTSGGFFDTEASLEEKLQLGALSARRKPFQDAPTPAGNPSAAIALLAAACLYQRREVSRQGRGHAGGLRRRGGAVRNLCRDLRHRCDLAVAAAHAGCGGWRRRASASTLLRAAIAPFAVNKSVVHLTDSEAVAQNLPPVLAETIPNLPALKVKRVGRDRLHELHLPPPVESAEETCLRYCET